jgi:O-antigen ligase
MLTASSNCQKLYSFGILAGDNFRAVPPLTLGAAALALLAAWRPAHALVVLAAFGPLGGVLSALSHTPTTWTIPLIIATLSGAWCGRAVRGEISTDRRLEYVGLCWTLLVAASLAILLAAQAPRDGRLAYLANVAVWLMHDFLAKDPFRYPGVWAAALAIGGVGIYLLVTDRCRREPALASRLTRMLLLGVAAGGALSAGRFAEALLEHRPYIGNPTRPDLVLRMSVVFPDVNAAGALFLMILPVAVWALTDRATRGLGAVTLACVVAGLWLASSRTTVVLVPFTLVAFVVLRACRRATQQWRAATAAMSVMTIAGGILLVALHPRTGALGGTIRALEIRREMALVAARMVRAHPVSGVGIGQFQARSTEVMSPLVRSWYASENAHNQFLQVAGELGLPGLALFVTLVLQGVAPAMGRAVINEMTPELAAKLAGLCGFVAAAFTMHPLLVPEVALAFWLMLGLTRSASLPASPAGGS